MGSCVSQAALTYGRFGQRDQWRVARISPCMQFNLGEGRSEAPETAAVRWTENQALLNTWRPLG
jgi:hypothetical protein